MKKILVMLISLVGIMSFLTGCGGAKLSPEVQKNFDTQAKLYTTRNMHYNLYRGTTKLIDTTNYQVGILIPVNSEVTMKAINAKQIVFIYKGQEIILRNIQKYTGVDISTIAQQYFSPNKVNLQSFTADEQKAIKFAKVVPGMSKKAVLVSLGTPPAHVTPTTDMDQWKYWKNRWVTFMVNFENGKTTAVKDAPASTHHGISFSVN